VDVLTQEPFHSGKAISTKKEIQLKTLLKDQAKKNCKYSLQNNKVLFGVNIDIGDWPDEFQALKRGIPPPIWCLSSFDGLAYLQKPILGVTKPQLYLKVEGVWTGAHQENLCLCSVNLNHGMGKCFTLF